MVTGHNSVAKATKGCEQTSDKRWAVSVANEEHVKPIFPCKWHQACCTPQVIKHTQMHDKLAPRLCMASDTASSPAAALHMAKCKNTCALLIAQCFTHATMGRSSNKHRIFDRKTVKGMHICVLRLHNFEAVLMRIKADEQADGNIDLSYSPAYTEYNNSVLIHFEAVRRHLF